MMVLDTAIVVAVSGGAAAAALGIAIGDRILMQEFAIYSVIPPRLRRDSVARLGKEG
jgi:acetyl-CoA carboxylase alpha subunit